MILIGNFISSENLGRRQKYLIEAFGRSELPSAHLEAKRAIRELQVDLKFETFGWKFTEISRNILICIFRRTNVYGFSMVHRGSIGA